MLKRPQGSPLSVTKRLRSRNNTFFFDLFSEYESPMDAGSKGAMDAMNLVMGIIANLMAIISVLALINGILTFMGERVGKTVMEYFGLESI